MSSAVTSTRPIAAGAKRRARPRSDPISAQVTNPAMRKRTAATARMASTLAKKSRNAPHAPRYAPKARQRPIAATGGLSAVAIATPGSAGLTRSSIIASTPAKPASAATKRSIRVGWVCASNDGVGSPQNGISPSRYVSTTPTSAPPNSAISAVRRSRRSLRMRPSDTPMIGVISGATTFAPIKVASLPMIRANPAISSETPSNA